MRIRGNNNHSEDQDPYIDRLPNSHQVTATYSTTTGLVFSNSHHRKRQAASKMGKDSRAPQVARIHERKNQ